MANNDASTLLAAQDLSFGEAQLVEWHWPSPLDLTVSEDRHMIEMSLPPFAKDGRASLPDLSPRHFSFMGGLFVRPAGVTIRALSEGGHIQVARVSVRPEAYADLAGTEIDYEEPALRAGFDLRDPTCRTLLLRLRQELLAPGFASGTLIDAYATALVLETARRLSGGMKQKASTGQLASWQYRRVCSRIADDPLPPTLDELAQLCRVSPRHFSRLYRGLTGEGVTTHIAHTQITRAKAMLEQRDLPLKEISARLGFSNPGSFSTAFRRATGVAPSNYRKACGAK